MVIIDGECLHGLAIGCGLPHRLSVSTQGRSIGYDSGCHYSKTKTFIDKGTRSIIAQGV